MSNEDIRQQIRSILDQVQTHPRQRAIEPALAVGEFLRSRDPASEEEVQALTEIAVDEQLSRGHSGMVEDALQALAGVADARLNSVVDRISAANLAITVCMIVDRMVRLGQLTPDEQVCACSCANLLDDRLVRGHGRYPRRATLLRLLQEGLERVADHVRHLDLVARFKWAVELAATDDDVLTMEAVEALRALLPAIEQRIAETVDAPGPGVRADGTPVAVPRIAGVLISAGPVEFMERYRSLPRLKAQALFELGRLLASFTFSSSTAGLEEAHDAFERASIAFQAASDAQWSASCAVAAAQCLAWLADDPTGPHARRLFSYGPQVHQQVLATGFPRNLKLSLAILAKNAYQRVEWHARLRTSASVAEAEAAVKRTYKEATIQFAMLRQQADLEPWSALACGSAAIEHIADFLDNAEAMMPPPADDDEQRARKERSMDTLRHYVTPAVVDAMAHALDRALDAPAPDLHDLAPESPAPDVWTPRAAPFAMSRRLHEAVSELLRAASIQRGLSDAQWAVVVRAMEGVRPLALGIAPLLALRKWEGKALGASATAGLAPGVVADYVERRITSLERHLANPILSVAERLLLSGWISHLAQYGRMCTEDFASLPPSRALVLIERCGASMFRSDALLFGRGAPTNTVGYQLAEHAHFEPPRESDPRVAAWVQVHLTRSLLDFWSRAKMVREASRVDPAIHRAFQHVLSDPPEQVLALPPDIPLEQIQHLTGATVDQCEVSPERTVIRFRPENLLQIDRHLDATRRWLTSALQALAAMNELRASRFASCPAPDPAAIERRLSRAPSTALVVPGSWPEEVSPLNLFSFRDGSLRRDTVAVGGDRDSIERVKAALDLMAALEDDRSEGNATSWQALDQALAQVAATYAPWSRALAEQLDAHGIRKVVFVLRGMTSAQIPWEMFSIDDRGTRFGDRFETTWVYTLAELPNTPAPHVRSGVGQVYGAGSSASQMELGALAMRSLADAGLAQSPLSGDKVCTPEGLPAVVATTTRARFFLHGYHDHHNPDADRLTLVDHRNPRQRINLHSQDLRRLPLAGMDSIELWACEGAAHGRPLQEHGVSDDPEDLTAALLLAGARRVVASRWQVPTLASALILERFALHVHGGARDSAALSAALRDYRAAFAAGGPIECRLHEAIERALKSLAAEPNGLRLTRRDEVLSRVAFEVIDEQRATWYRSAGLNGPSQRIGSVSAMDRMARVLPPRAEQIAASLQGGSDAVSRQLTDEMLAPYRNPASWCGWRVTLRDPSHLE